MFYNWKGKQFWQFFESVPCDGRGFENSNNLISRQQMIKEIGEASKHPRKLKKLILLSWHKISFLHLFNTRWITKIIQWNILLVVFLSWDPTGVVVSFLPLFVSFLKKSFKTFLHFVDLDSWLFSSLESLGELWSASSLLSLSEQ